MNRRTFLTAMAAFPLIGKVVKPAPIAKAGDIVHVDYGIGFWIEKCENPSDGLHKPMRLKFRGVPITWAQTLDGLTDPDERSAGRDTRPTPSS